MKTFKNLIPLLLIFGFSFSAYARQTPATPQQEKEVKKSKKLKKHSCTEECHKTKEHHYKHGEKGHVCDERCKKK